MKVVKVMKGKGAGSISVRKTIATMQVGEVWTTSSRCINYDTARSVCSSFGSAAGMQFSVSSPMEAKGRIVIRRNQ